MKEINITEILDRFKAALNYEQSEYERSPMFGEDGNYDTGYARGLWKAYSILVDTAYFFMKEKQEGENEAHNN